MNMLRSGVARIYIRLSRNKDDQTSTARQEADGRALAAREKCHTVIIYLEEPGTSGYADVALPVRDKIVADMEPGDLMISWSFDRLTRRGMEDAGRLLRQIEESRGYLKTVTDGVDSTQNLGDLNVGVKAILAREESRKISTRVSSAKALARREGRWLGGKPPYGLRVDKKRKKLEPDPATATIARGIAEDFLAGQSAWSITKRLNAEGIPSGSGGTWAVGALIQIARSPAWAGLQSQRTRTASGGWSQHAEVWLHEGEPVSIGEGIITPGERSLILAGLDARALETGGRTKAGTPARRGRRDVTTLLGDVLRCGRCGGRVALSGTPKYRSYRCVSTARGRGCAGFTSPMDGTDEAVSTALLHRLVTLEPGEPLLEEVGHRWTAHVAPESVIAREEARAALAAANADLDRTRALLADGTFDVDDGAVLMPRIRERIASATAALAAVPVIEVNMSPLLDIAQSRPAWDSLPVEKRRALIGLAVESVSVSPAKGRGHRFVPRERLSLTWADGTTTRGAAAWTELTVFTPTPTGEFLESEVQVPRFYFAGDA